VRAPLRRAAATDGRGAGSAAGTIARGGVASADGTTVGGGVGAVDAVPVELVVTRCLSWLLAPC